MPAWLLLLAAALLGAAALVRRCGLHRLLPALASLVDLLLTVKRRARAIQTKHPQWTMTDALEEAFWVYWDREFVVVAGNDDAAEEGEKGEGGDEGEENSPGGRRSMTYGEAERASSAVANFVTSDIPPFHAPNHLSHAALNCQPGDIVAIFMPGGCEFLVSLFGLIRCGARAALVNTGLRGTSLAHALTVALEGEAEGGSGTSDRGSGSGSGGAVRAVLVSPCLRHALDALAGRLPPSLRIVEVGAGRELDPWTETERFAYLGLTQEQAASRRWDDVCLYIYTSGTTGLPKAVRMNHLRIWSGGCVGRKVCRLRGTDRLYCPLPLHHGSALMLAVGACLQRGCCCVVRPRFSVKAYSADVLDHRCTGVQYIGEMARYLVAAPPNPLDSKVRLRFAFGNGLPSEVWTTFQKRYNIGLIHEFYASTEGNVNVVNNTGLAPGACGIVPAGFGWLYPIGIYRYDADNDELVRDATTGLCVPAGPNEPGELLGLIQESDPSRRFDGYADGAATRAKVATDVRVPGDRYFRSGDLLRKDRWGFLYFCDRVGETFRWKGENVSASEVARALLGCGASDGIGYFAEAVVYGVEVQGNPGRAGMATVVVRQADDDTSDGNGWQEPVWRALQAELPRYAQPLFVRVAREIEKTGTQKYKKNRLQAESFLKCGSDPVYFRDDAAKSFVRMDETIKDGILSGERRV